jgi:hypothetical protein
MARAPLPGVCKTRLARSLGLTRAAELYRAMLLDTLTAYSSVPFSGRVVLAAPEDDGVAVLRGLAPPGWSVQVQLGSDLGARLAHARGSFDDRAIILASSDSPTAPVAALRAVLAQWKDPKQVLLGPCADGGYYLIGLAVPESRVFDGIPWSTDQVASRTKERCNELGLSVLELPTSYDIDEPDDVERLRIELELDPSRAPCSAAALKLL